MKATRRHLWRHGAALAGGIAVGFVFVSALRQTPYDAPTTLTRLYHYDGPSGCEGATSQEDCQLRRRLQESDREKAIRLEQQIGSGRADGTGVRPLRCFQGYQQIQGGGHWTQGAVVNNASLPSDGEHLDLADHALLLSNARVRPVTHAATDEAGILKTCDTVSTATVRTGDNRCVLVAQTNSQARPHQVLSYTKDNIQWRLAPTAPRGAFPAASPRFALQRAARQNALIRATPRLVKVIGAACAAASLEPHAASSSVAMALDGRGLPMFGSVRDAVNRGKPRRRVVLLAAATADVVNVLNLVASARMHGPYKAVVAAADDRAAAALRGVVGLEVITDPSLQGDAHWARLAALSLVTTLGYDVLSLDAQTTFAADPEKVWSALYDASAEAAFRYDGGAAGPLPIDAGVMLLRGGERSAAVADLLLTQASLASARGSFKDVVDAVLPEARAYGPLGRAVGGARPPLQKFGPPRRVCRDLRGCRASRHAGVRH